MDNRKIVATPNLQTWRRVVVDVMYAVDAFLFRTKTSRDNWWIICPTRSSAIADNPVCKRQEVRK